jgi:septum formation protein
MTLILGSQSPRRREILSFFSIPFKQISPHFDEEAVPFKGDPKEYARTISEGKSDSLAALYTQDLILTADTVVFQGGKIFGKPLNEKESYSHLKDLVEGKQHSVFTSVTLRQAHQKHTLIEETKVLFNDLTHEQIQNYHRVLPCTDKAGGYMIQGAGSLIIKKIDGCYYNVMGLPVNALAELFQKFGIDLWRHLK